MAEVDPHQFVTKSSITNKTYRDIYPQINPTLPALSQEGKVVLITGASRGLGKLSFAASFAKANAKAIVLTARKIDSLKSTEELIKSINPAVEVMSAALEVTDQDSVKKLFEEIGKRFEKVDVLLNNAGVFNSAHQTIVDADVDSWWGDMEINVKGQMLVGKHWLKHLGEKQGTYIGLTSMAATFVAPGMSGYALSKLGDAQLAAFIAAENPNVTAYAYHPGMIVTDMHDNLPEFAPFALDTPELAGAFAVWLTTDAASFLNGRYVSLNWAVDELMAMKEKVFSSDALKITIGGQLVEAVVDG